MKALERLLQISEWNSMKLGFDQTLELLSCFDHPQKKLKTIHIAGSNGKGSVATKIARSLQLAGHKVGLYTSPHISSVCERIQIDGYSIDEAELEKKLSEIFKICDQENLQTTFFEALTCAAWLIFRDHKVDVAVIEVGLGGRLDATNLIHPLLSVITSISMEHTEILGKTLDAIAFEKGGIIKERVPVVIGPTIPLEPILKIANEKMSPVIQVHATETKTFDQENSEVAKAALLEIGKFFSINFDGLKAKPPGRMEFRSGIWIDGAHNPTALERILQEIHDNEGKKPHVIFSLSKREHALPCFKILKHSAETVRLPYVHHQRLLDSKVLYTEAIKAGIPAERIIHCDSIQEAIKPSGGHESPILATGSLYLIDSLYKALKNH